VLEHRGSDLQTIRQAAQPAVTMQVQLPLPIGLRIDTHGHDERLALENLDRYARHGLAAREETDKGDIGIVLLGPDQAVPVRNRALSHRTLEPGRADLRLQAILWGATLIICHYTQPKW